MSMTRQITLKITDNAYLSVAELIQLSFIQVLNFDLTSMFICSLESTAAHHSY